MGAYKTFQEILEEQMEGTKVHTPVEKKESLPPLIEFDFSFLTRPRVSSAPSVKAYPKTIAPVLKPVVAPAPAAPRAKDLTIAVNKLTSAEVSAFRLLGIEAAEFLSRNEVKTKYRSLVRKFHPDRHAMGITANERRVLTEKFYSILESYEILNEAFARLAPSKQN